MHQEDHHKREAIFLISFLLVFGIIFMMGIINLRRGTPMFGVMGNYEIEDWTVIFLSLVAVIRVFVELMKDFMR